MKKTLGVVIANYNHAHFLERCLTALLSQSRKAEQIVIVDDCSTDNSLEVVARFKDHSITVLRNAKNSGPVHSYRRGLDALTTDYFFGGAADDMVLPGFFEKCMAAIERWPSTGGCAAHPALMNDETVDENLITKKFSNETCVFSPQEMEKLVAPGEMWIAGHASIVNRKAFVEVSKYSDSIKWHWDWFGLHIVALRSGLCYIPEPLSALRLDPNTYSTAGRRNSKAQAEVMWNMARILNFDEFQDVKAAVIRSRLLEHYPEFSGRMVEMLVPWNQTVPSEYLPGRAFARGLSRGLKDEFIALKQILKAQKGRGVLANAVFRIAKVGYQGLNVVKRSIERQPSPESRAYSQSSWESAPDEPQSRTLNS